MRRQRIGRWILTGVLTVFGIFMLAPLAWLVSESLTEETSAFYLPPSWIPRDFTLENFAAMAELIPFGRMFLNSVIVSVTATAGALLVSLMAAYAFSRLRFRYRDHVFALMLAALMVPMQMTIIPVFFLMRTLGLVDTLGSLILPALINVFAIFFFRQYFNSIPRELDEAATLDGAGHGWILFRMLIPLSGPAIAAMTILNFEATWNNYFGPLIFIRTEERMTLPLGLVTLQAGQSGSSVVVFAAITGVVVPALVVFLLFQRAFISSVATAGVRG